MRCPDCQKQIQLVAERCPYCGAALPQSGQITATQDNQRLNVKKLSNRKWVRIIISLILTPLCFFVLQLIVMGVYSHLLGINAGRALGVAATTIRWKVILLCFVSTLAFGGYSIFTVNGKRPIIFCSALVTLCAIGALLFANTRSLDAFTKLLSQGLIFTCGFGLPMLHWALLISLLSHNSPNALRQTIIVIAAFFTASVIGAILGVMRTIRGSIHVGISIIYILFGSVVAFTISLVLEWRSTK